MWNNHKVMKFWGKKKKFIVCITHQAINGLKQAPRAWNSIIDKYFMNNGFKNSSTEPSLYIEENNYGKFLIVCLCVGDFIYTRNDLKHINQFKESMMQEF